MTVVIGEPVDVLIDASTRLVLNAIGRTEDLAVSPDGRALAVAGFSANRVVVLNLGESPDGSGTPPAVTGHLAIDSPSLSHPHGLAWLDDTRLIVANRTGRVRIFEIPRSTPTHSLTLTPARTLWGLPFTRIRHPGSVSVSPTTGRYADVLVCNNYTNRVSRHTVTFDSPPRVERHQWLLRRRLRVPDGVTVSADRRWLAISNHGTHEVFVYRWDPSLDVNAEPDAVLDGTQYPHGLRFTPDGLRLVVADAGAPGVHLYESAESGWRGRLAPRFMVRTMPNDTFERGRLSEEEGGPKGLELLGQGGVLVTTSTHQALAFHRLPTPSAPIIRA